MANVRLQSDQQQLLKMQASNLMEGIATAEEKRASALIAGGIMKGHECARALLLLIVNHVEKEQRGLQRTCASKLKGVSQECLMELGYKLSGLVGSKGLCREIGLSVKGLPPINFFDETLPTPFCADLLSSKRLTMNITRAVELCSSEFKRDLATH